MKKLLFVLAFAFIGQQAFSQSGLYIITLSFATAAHPSGCDSDNTDELCLTIIPPTGAQTYRCISKHIHTSSSPLLILHQELNDIILQGYKLIETNNGDSEDNGLINITELNPGTTWYFAAPWSASGLEEVSTTLKSFIISPNPTNTFVDISLDYPLKGEGEVVFISEGGYIFHKQSIGKILKNEKYNIDISKIPAGKYLVTIVNGKTYTTPQKLIVL